jgi:hypothetical protein
MRHKGGKRVHAERSIGYQLVAIRELETVADLVYRAVTFDFLYGYDQVHGSSFPVASPLLY